MKLRTNVSQLAPYLHRPTKYEVNIQDEMEYICIGLQNRNIFASFSPNNSLMFEIIEAKQCQEITYAFGLR